MWQPDPGWRPLRGGLGPSTVGVWRAQIAGRPVVVKRLARTLRTEEAGTDDPRHFAYWRRAADVALSGVVDSTPGLRAPVTAVEEDADGITLVQEWVEEVPHNGLHAAACLGRFAGADLGDAPWLARDQLRDRLRRVERGGGWSTLARTPVADVADHLWRHRERHLDELDGLPVVAQHGDPVRDNLVGRHGETIVAIDWGTLGHGPVGGDLGYLALSTKEEFEPLLEAYGRGLPVGTATPEQVVLGSRLTAVYTALSRAEWALARVSPGAGALAGKFHHPSVAPYLLALQRLYPQVEALL
jgi:hypothetical protein